MEPIDARFVDESWEATGSDTESLSNWREAKINVQIALNLVKEEIPELIWCV